RDAGTLAAAEIDDPEAAQVREQSPQGRPLRRAGKAGDRAAKPAVCLEELGVVIDVLRHRPCSPSVVPTEGNHCPTKKPRPFPAGPLSRYLSAGEKSIETGALRRWRIRRS